MFSYTSFKKSIQCCCYVEHEHEKSFNLFIGELRCRDSEVCYARVDVGKEQGTARLVEKQNAKLFVG